MDLRNDKRKLNELIDYCATGPIKAETSYAVHQAEHIVGISVDEYMKASHTILALRADVTKANKIIEELNVHKEWAEAQLDADREAFAKIEYGNPGRRPCMINHADAEGKKRDGTFKAWFLGFTRDEEGIPSVMFEKQDGSVRYADLSFITFFDWYTKELNEMIDDGDTDPTV